MRILIVSQVYVPDPAAVGQYMADAASELVRSGHQVRVFTSARGYADPGVRFRARETIDGVDVVRLPLSSLGKRTIAHRLVGQTLFLTQVVLRGLFGSRPDAILVSTSPPMASIAALVIGRIRRVPLNFWAMDLNPDQVIAIGKVSPDGLVARAFDALNRRLLRTAETVVALDRFMADRLNDKHPVNDKAVVIPPWPQFLTDRRRKRSDNPFAVKHGLTEKFVVMYSGNHGIFLPLATLLQTAHRLADDDRFRFVFIGDGVRKAEVERHVADHPDDDNVLVLPYQPFDTLPDSLGSADVHVVSMTDDMVGIIHPCKIYGTMAVGRPTLYFGPRPSHVADLLDRHRCGWQVDHGDAPAAVRILQEAITERGREECQRMGNSARAALDDALNPDRLRREFVNAIAPEKPEAPSHGG